MKNSRTPVHLALLFAAALFCVLCTGHPKSASAYFTAYTTAKGTVPLHLKSDQEFHEEVVIESMTKTVNITNDTNTPCFVRVRAYAPSNVELQYNSKEWEKGEDGYCYYPLLLKPGEKVRPLVIKVIPKSEPPADFNVAVISESIPAVYDTDGTPYAAWYAED